jgi:DNA-binding response OmpR family regulator
MMFIPNLLSAESGSESIVRARIVVVEDEPDLRDAVAEYLDASGYDVATAESASAARTLLETQSFHLAILDIAMPGEDGLSLGRWMRSKTPIGIIYATAAGTALDRIVGLELGADDYLGKPFAFTELVARILALGRRRGERAPAVLQRGDVVLDLGRQEVRRGERFVQLTRKEFGVLAELVRADGDLVSAEQLLDRVWDENADPLTGAVRTVIKNLRAKLGEPDPIRTVAGRGYRLP